MNLNRDFILWSFLCLLSCLVSFCRGQSYTNEWAVEVSGGREEAEEIAKSLNCQVVAKIFDDTFLLSHNHVSKRSTKQHEDAHRSIVDHPSVRWAEQQKVLSRKKRQMWRMPNPAAQYQRQNKVPEHYEDAMHMNDQRWPQMWYLNRGGRLDMNVQEAWQMGITGKGVSITILDDGVEKTHPDIVANYDPQASFDVNENDNDPSPRYDLVDSNRHGTRCAGEVSATANNSECGVGIAYGSGIGGVRMLDGDVTDAVEARSVGLNNQHIAIYSASWGPDDDGKTVDGPGRLATRAFLQGIDEGRGGKGSIFVWASGNGGRDSDNCNCDGYTNAVWTLSVSSATENGLVPWYSEACSSTLASTYSSGSSGERKVVTTDLHHQCTSSHTGTSASAPLAAGIMALCLEANPDLTWRDVQHLTVRCAHRANLRANDWAVNSLGRNFSHSFGYGIMDATCMVKLAKEWKSASEQKKCKADSKRIDVIVPGRSVSKATIEVKECGEVHFLEHVQCHVTLAATKRGDVVIFLVSPSGTRSNLVAKRPRDYSRAGFNDWPFLTVHMWEENPIGTWTLEIQNDGRSIVQLKEFSLVLMGTKGNPHPSGTIPVPAPKSENEPQHVEEEKVSQPPPPNVKKVEEVTAQKVPSIDVLQQEHLQLIDNCERQRDPEWCDKCVSGFYLHTGRCVDKCPKVGFFSGKDLDNGAICVPCYYSCKTCSGPNDYECISCFGDADLEEESFAQHFCHNKSLIERVYSSSRWYYVLSLGFLINFCIVAILVVYILRWRRGKESAPILPKRKTSANNGRSNSLYSPVKLENGRSNDVTRPFHDFGSSSDDEELLRKPYTDEVKS